MSGGSYDYAYSKIYELSKEIQSNDDPRRIAFKKMLELCSEAAYAIEWVDSGDTSPGDEHEAIDKVFKHVTVDYDVLYKTAIYDKIKSLMKI